MEAAKLFRGGFLCLLYIILSATLIQFNKRLVNKHRFPHAMVLTTMHMAVTCFFCNTLYLLKPSLYPSMENTQGKKLQLLKWFAPLGLLFAIGLFCSNQAYLYCSAAFLQFVKEANIVLVFAFSCFVGLNAWSKPKVANMAWIIIGASISVRGEVHFKPTGFIFQIVSQFGECSKNVLGDVLMNGNNLKLDPLSYTMFMAPMCLVVLLVGSYFQWNAQTWPDIVHWWPLLIPNACLAFVLNLTIAMLIKECSAVAFILSGIIKDIVIVLVSACVFGESVVLPQVFGFIICLTGVFFWSYSRVQPDSKMVQAFENLLGKEYSPEEKTTLIPPVKEKMTP